jgi:hypothetical protein
MMFAGFVVGTGFLCEAGEEVGDGGKDGEVGEEGFNCGEGYGEGGSGVELADETGGLVVLWDWG